MLPKDMVCKSCGAPIADKDITAVQGGLMAKCPYCGADYVLKDKRIFLSNLTTLFSMRDCELTCL